MNELPGTPIVGSRLVRDYCETCGEPIRVVGITNVHGKRVRSKCSTCHHPPPNKAATMDDESPWQQNNIRILENG